MYNLKRTEERAVDNQILGCHKIVVNILTVISLHCVGDEGDEHDRLLLKWPLVMTKVIILDSNLS